MKTEMKAPADCNDDELCQIGNDNFSVGDFSILTDSFHVWLSEHKSGEAQKQHIEIPPKVFKKLVEWYLKPQKLSRDERQK
jgi:hypothetical protein